MTRSEASAAESGVIPLAPAQWTTKQEAAAAFHVPLREIETLVTKNLIRHCRPFKRRMVSIPSINAYYDSCVKDQPKEAA